MTAAVREKWKNEIKGKSLVVPGQLPIEDTLPQAEAIAYAPLPAFKLLVVNGKSVKHPGSQEQGHCLPDEVPTVS